MKQVIGVLVKILIFAGVPLLSRRTERVNQD
jgi:hypothetical protein